MALLLPPDLDIRNEEQIAAEAIGRVSGSLTVARIDSQVTALRNLRDLILNGSLPPGAICPELTNANPSSPHTVLLETQGWLLAQQARRINQLPVRDQIEFARLFGIELREPTAATATLEFTLGLSQPDNLVVIPAQTQVSTADGSSVFETDEEIIAAYPVTEISVSATRTVAGHLLLAPDTLTVMEDAIIFVSSVTNPDPVDSGSDAETVEQALARARNYQRRAERLVSARDVEDMVFEELLQGAGIVKAFPFIKLGDFGGGNRAGHTTLIVMTAAGNPVSEELKLAILEELEPLIGSQFVYLIDPIFVTFSVEADIKIEGITPQLSIKAAVEKNLRDFYATKKGNFGRPILRSEIIATIEGTPGVDRIASDANGPIVGSPAADVTLAPYELPELDLVTLNVVP